MVQPTEAQITPTAFLIYNQARSGPPQLVAWELQVDHVTTQITRTAAIIPLPSIIDNQDDADVFNNRPVAWVLDLGLMEENVILRGRTADFEQNPSIPSIFQMDEIVRCVSTGLGSLDSFTLGTPVFIEFYGGPTSGASSNPAVGNNPGYAGIIAQFQKDRDSGDTVWSWTLTLSVADWNRAYFQQFNLGQALA